MEYHVEIDVSLELSSLCVLDATGKVIREAKVASEPEALVAFLCGLGVRIIRVGLEAGPLSQWLYDKLQKAGFEPVLLETRQVKAALSAISIKTERRDARGIAQLLRMGWYRPVQRKSVPSQEVRALLAARKQMQIKAMDLGQTLRGLLRGFGLKVGDVSRGKRAARIRELVSGHAMLERIAEPMLTARGVVERVRQAASRGPGDRQGEPGLQATDDGAGALMLLYRSSGTDRYRSINAQQCGWRDPMETVRQGGCSCGAVRLEARGEPIRVGLCHCLTCRKETGGPFMAFAVWDSGHVSVTGETRSWTGTTDHRHFCPNCGSALFSTHDTDNEIEVRLGCFDDAPTDWVPEYELWTGRREHWMPPIAGAAQHRGNRPG